MKRFTISVSASSANIGPGFDSAGLALNRYLTLEVVRQEKWEIKQDPHFLPPITHYEDHFIYKTAKQIAEQHNEALPACKVNIKSTIPLARGLGSSASAVLAGIELANQLCDFALSKEQKLMYATKVEGHPDNVAPVLFGGIVISAATDHGIDYIELPALDLDIVVYIPDVELQTDAARSVLPNHFSRKDAAAASGISNLMIASLVAKDYALAGKMMEQDLFHEPYRAALIPNYQAIKSEAKKYGAFGTVISGAGPTMISFVPKGEGYAIAAQMKAGFPAYEVAALNIDHNGLQVKQDFENEAAD